MKTDIKLAKEFDPDALGFADFVPANATCEDVQHTFDETCTPVQISSPGYPELYTNNLSCKWTFTAPRNHRVSEI